MCATPQNTSKMLKVCLLLVGLLVWVGCKKPPTQSYKDALDAIRKAQLAQAKDCAKDEYRAAESMLAKAKQWMDEKKYDKAKVAFDAARKLALKAREEAILNKDKCKKKNTKKVKVAKSAAPPQVIESPEKPVIDQRPSLTPVYFEFNKHQIKADSKMDLQKHAEWMKKSKAPIRIQIEGHCDQRGSVEYNLALGEKRALSVKKYLQKLGVDVNRVSIISYGHQRPADPGQSESAYSKNRRAEFKVGQGQ
ncbi:MAG: peptidoglycan-associated lipoprotein Pal [Myxococcota bacterium]